MSLPLPHLHDQGRRAFLLEGGDDLAAGVQVHRLQTHLLLRPLCVEGQI